MDSNHDKVILCSLGQSRFSICST